MRLISLLIVAIFTLYAAYPSVFARLGDKLYKNHDAIAAYSDLPISPLYLQRIKLYLVDLNKTMQMGFAIEHKAPDAIKPNLYLERLRKLSKENDYILRIAERSLERSIDEENTTLFVKIIETGIIDLDNQYQQVFPYYETHQEEINSSMLSSWIDSVITPQRTQKSGTKKALNPYSSTSKAQRLRQKQQEKERAMNAKIDSEIKAEKEKLNKQQIESLKTE